MSKVTGVITNHNYEKFVVGAIESMLAQKDVDWAEIIVVDDLSTDKSVDTIKKFLESPKVAGYGIAIRLIERKVNGGPAGARNSGIEQATGDYIAFLDADDIYLAGKISKSVRILDKNPEVSLVYSDYDVLKDGVSKREYKFPYIYNLLWQQCIVSTNSVYRRKVFSEVGMFDERFRGTEDYQMYLKIATRSMLYHIPEALFIYRLHGNNITETTNHQLFANDIAKFKQEILQSVGARP